MVNLSLVSLVKATPALMVHLHPKNVYQDGYWRKRQVLRLTSHMYGRGRNCFSLAIRRLQKSLQYVTGGRSVKIFAARQLWLERVDAGVKELGYVPNGAEDMMEALQRANILLNRQSLANLAIWEPRTFESICKVAAVKAKQEDINAKQLGPPPPNIFTRGKL